MYRRVVPRRRIIVAVSTIGAQQPGWHLSRVRTIENRARSSVGGGRVGHGARDGASTRIQLDTPIVGGLTSQADAGVTEHVRL